MKQLIKKCMVGLSIVVLGISLLAAPVYAAAAKDGVCEGIGLASGGNGCADPASSPSVESIIKIVINLLTLVVGIAAVIMIIIGGLKYILSSGDSANISSAKNTILYAIIGLVIVALAQVIVRFVVNKIA
jgi:hypothetical protein